MPAQRSRAAFDPIPPNFDVGALVEQTPNFQYVDRISCDMIDQQGMEAFDKLVLLHVIIGGKPLIIDGYHSRLDEWTFSSKWLQDNHGDKVEPARNQTKREPLPLTIGHYMRNMTRLSDQYFEKPNNYREKDRQRIYLKDIDCPPVWNDKLRENLPPNLYYLNENTGEIGGPGAADEMLPSGGKRKGRGIAPAGDLMSNLPPSMRAENLMCYIGHEGTYTPAHREMCGSLGHNIMVETSNFLGDDGKPERPGSSIWFMTESKDRHAVSEYWLSILGHDIEVENHFAQIAAWKKAPFSVYVVEQRAGDFILIPPLAPHQVWNRGTRTMKVAWNRTTVETLELALKEALPRARLVCRDEQYKNKAIVFFTLQKYSGLLARARDQQRTAPTPQAQSALRSSPRIRNLQKDFKRLFGMFRDIVLSEMFAREAPNERNVQFLPFDSNVTCAYCRGNIFNRFLSCSSCDDMLGTSEPEPYDICMECYVMGRSCGCISKLRWVEQFKWKELVHKYEQWRKQYIELEGGQKTGSPLPIQDERANLGKNTLAQICQKELKRRPWVDVHKPPSEKEDDSADSDNDQSIEIGEDGMVKKKKRKRNYSESFRRQHRRCHVCCKHHEKWKMVECPCGRWWCFGTLFRGHDLMPQQIMEQPDWNCPHCKRICSAGACRKDPRQNSYQPKGTLLGYDTRKVADARSIESLIDFSVPNLNWLGETTETPENNARLRSRQEEANRAKADDPTLDDPYASNDEQHLPPDDPRHSIAYEPDESALDPQLNGMDGQNGFIDPIFHQGAPDPSGFTSANQPSRSTAFQPVAGMRNGARPPGASDSLDDPEYSGYEPATQSGFVAPQAVMYQPPPQYEDEDEDSSDLDNAPTSSNRKRKDITNDDVIRTAPSRKRNRDALFSKNVSSATKQYRKEHEKRALEEARKKGHFIKVHAALHGKSRIAKLGVGREKLLTFQRANKHPTADGNVLLRSDVAPAQQPSPGASGKGSTSSKPKQIRIRVEKDDDFSTRRRDRRSTGTKSASAPKKPHRKSANYEEVELDSDIDNDADGAGDAALETTKGGAKKRRISAWQTKRHAESSGEESEFEELPEHWKDGRRSGGRRVSGGSEGKDARGKADAASDATGRSSFEGSQKPAGKTVAQIRPRDSISTAQEGEDSEGVDERAGGQSRRDRLAAVAEAASTLPANGTHGADEEDEDNVNDDTPVKRVATTLPATNSSSPARATGSILRKGGPGGSGRGRGKKVKIVSAKARLGKTAGHGSSGDAGDGVKSVAMGKGRLG